MGDAYQNTVALLNQENLNGAIYLNKIDSVRTVYTPFPDLIRDVLEWGVADGMFRLGVDPT
jgi:Tetracyclin repressor-like, C-terminal domain